jgi:hypothetical protein
MKWATDENYPGSATPSAPWGGTPTKVAPTEGEAAAGWVPGAQLQAPWLNYILNQLTADSRAAADPAQNWGPVNEDDSDLNWDTWHAQRFCSVRDQVSGLPYLVGILDAGSIMRSSDLKNWTSVSDTVVTGGSPGVNMFCFAARHEVYVCTPTDGAIYAATNIAGSNPFTLRNDTAYTGLSCGVWYEAEGTGAGRLLIGGDTDIAYSDNVGVSWTTATTPNNLDVAGFVTPEMGEAASTYILALTTGVGGALPLVSSDGGETWAESSNTFSGHASGWASGCYRASDQSYWVCSTVGRVYTTRDPSPSGTWTFVATMGDASRKCTAVGRSVVMAPRAYTGSVQWSGNIWVFPEGEDPLQVNAGDPALTWGGGVFRHDGAIVALRAREVSSNVWHAETSLSLRSRELTRWGLTYL